MMKSKKVIDKNINDQNRFLTACVCSILLLLTLCYFGFNNSFKGTSANSTVSFCAAGENLIASGSSYYCCPSVYGTGATIFTHGGNSYCVPDNVEVGELLASETGNPICSATVDYTLSSAEQKIYDTYVSPAIGVKFLAGNPSTVNNIINKVQTNLYGNSWDIQRVDIDFNNDNQKDYFCTFNPDLKDGEEYLVRCEMESTLADGCFAETSVVAPSGNACYYAENNGEKTYVWGDYKGVTGFSLDPNYTNDIDCLSNGKYDIVFDVNGADDRNYTDDFGPKDVDFNASLDLSGPIINEPTKTVKVVINKNNISNLDVGDTPNVSLKFKGLMYNGYDSNVAFSYAQYANGSSWNNIALGTVFGRVSVRRLAPDGATAKLSFIWERKTVELPSIYKNGQFCTWNTKADGSGTTYTSQQNVIFDTNTPNELNLYAICNSVPSTTIHANGGGLINSNGDLTQTAFVKNCSVLSNGVCNLKMPTPISTNGLSFIGWSTDDNCSSYKLFDDVDVSTSTNYYACWGNNPYHNSAIVSQKADFVLNESSKNIDLYIDVPPYDENKIAPSCTSSNTSVVTCKINYDGSGEITLSLTKGTKEGTSIVSAKLEKASDSDPDEGYLNIRVTVGDGGTIVVPTDYTVVLNSNNCGTVNDNIKTVKFGSTYGTLPTPTKTGYTFNGWYTSASGGTKVTSSTIVNNASNHNLYAQCSPYTYTVKYDANGGSGAPSNQTKTYNSGLNVSSTIPTKTGYEFSVWNTKADGTGKSFEPSATLSNDVFNGLSNGGTLTLYAIWEDKSTSVTHLVVFKSDGKEIGRATCIVPNGQTKCKINESDVPSPSKIGYTLIGWNNRDLGNVSSSEIVTYTPNGTEYTARWEANEYTVSYDANGGTGAPSAQKFRHGATLKLSSTSPTRPGYRFMGWALSATSSTVSYSPGGDFSKNEDTKLYAVWIVDSGDETPTKTAIIPTASLCKTNLVYNGQEQQLVNSTSGVGYDLSGYNQTNADTYTIFAILHNGYKWNDNSTGIKTFTCTIAEAPVVTPESKIFAAKFDANNGTLNGVDTKYCTAIDTSCDITSLPTATRSGYVFKGWGTDASCTSGQTSKLTLTKDTTFKACWEKNASVDVDGNTTGNPTTGDITIALIWFGGIFAIAYAFWYFKKSKEN